MRLYFATLQRKDYRKAIRFIAEGMHFDWYVKSTLLQRLLARYYLYAELQEATQVIAAYADRSLVGLLVADVNGEPRPFESAGRACFVKLFECLGGKALQDSMACYDRANKGLLRAYGCKHSVEGKIGLLVVDPIFIGKGIGSRLLNEFEKREKGKNIILYTDDACVYQFYEHRGFQREGEQDILMELTDRITPLRCFLYSKAL